MNKAIEIYDKVLEKVPNDITTLTNKGIALSKLERYIDAITIFDQVLNIEPDNANCLCNIVIAYENMGKVSEASDYEERAPKNCDSDFVDKPPATDTTDAAI